jgi:hypothetical protein
MLQSALLRIQAIRACKLGKLDKSGKHEAYKKYIFFQAEKTAAGSVNSKGIKAIHQVYKL